MAINPNVPPINPPLAELNSLTRSVDQIRQGVESLGGLRGNYLDRAVTLGDLVKLGVVSEVTIRAALK